MEEICSVTHPLLIRYRQRSQHICHGTQNLIGPSLVLRKRLHVAVVSVNLWLYFSLFLNRSFLQFVVQEMQYSSSLIL